LRADERRRTSAAAGSAGIAPDLDAAYRVLGVGAAASDGAVKRAYRRLMNRHHPDQLAARGLSEAEVARAEQKTHGSRAADDRIQAHRLMKLRGADGPPFPSPAGGRRDGRSSALQLRAAGLRRLAPRVEDDDRLAVRTYEALSLEHFENAARNLARAADE